MLSIRNIGASADSHKYYVEYAQGHGEPPGEWWGESLRDFGVHENVTAEEMKNLLHGFSSDGETSLAQNAGQGHRGGWDLTFSPPKSVSIVWANAEEKLRGEIEGAQKEAVKAALNYLNKFCAEVRAGKKGLERHKAQLCGAMFEHGSNRNYEPQLHTHVVVFNIAKSLEDGKWRCPESRHIYEGQMAASAHYKAELASRMQTLGFNVEKAGHSFEVVGVPKEVCEAQSQRSEQIKAALEEKGLDKDSASARAREVATLVTRNEKKGICRDFERWQSENEALGFGKEELAKLRALGRVEQKAFNSQTLSEQALKQLTLQNSTFGHHDLHFRIGQESIGLQNAAGVLKTASEAKQNDMCVEVGVDDKGRKRFSTPDIIKIENTISEILVSRATEAKHILKSKDVEKAIASHPTLNQEQRAAVSYLCLDKSGTSFIEGQAGTGKSFLLSVVREAYEKSGYELKGLSFTNKAAKNLESSSGIKSQSVDSFLYEVKDKRVSVHSKMILVIDEAGMLDSRKTLELVTLANEAKAKLVFVGDARQIQPILAGQAFEAQRKLSDSRQITRVFRQKQAWERNAVQNIREGNVKKSLEAFAKNELLKFKSNRTQIYEQMILDWHKEVSEKPKSSAIMIATKNAEVSILNEKARAVLVKSGKLKAGIEIETQHGKSNFSVGDRIIFTGNYKRQGIYNSVLGTIEKVSDRKVIVRTEDRQLVSFDPREFNKFRHGYAITAHKSQGSTVDRALVLVDGFSMDREKFYVAVSRGRENNTIYCDKSSLREMPFEKRKALKGRPASVKRQVFRDHFIRELAAIVGVSHQKDSTQNYREQSHQKIERLLKRFQEKTAMGRGIDKLSQLYNEKFNDLKVSIRKTISKLKSLHNKERRAEKSKNQENERGR